MESTKFISKFQMDENDFTKSESKEKEKARFK